MARIFVLEDDKISKAALKEMLYSIMSDITVDTAGSLAEARQLLDSTVSFDLFLLDVNLDKENGSDSGGITFAEEVRNMVKYEFTPVVMITSIAGLEVDTYEELVERQSEYIKEISMEGGKQYLPLLRISDKVLAGFLYSKIVSSGEGVETEIEVLSKEIISSASEHSLIEVVGVLVDNAYEACVEAGGKVRMILDSRQDRLIFRILNQHEKIPLEKIGHFFENGYSTKNREKGRRGLGLYRARAIVQKAGGEITVEQNELGGENFIQFTIVI